MSPWPAATEPVNGTVIQMPLYSSPIEQNSPNESDD